MVPPCVGFEAFKDTTSPIVFTEKSLHYSNGKILASAGGGEIYLWDVEQGHVYRILEPTHFPKRIAFSPKGFLVSVEQVWMDIWDIESMKEVKEVVVGPDWQVYSNLAISFSPDGSLLAVAGGYTKSIKLYYTKRWGYRPIEGGRLRQIWCVAFSHDGTVLAAGTDKGEVVLWDIASGQILNILRHPSKVLSVAFSPDGKILVSATEDGDLWIWGIQGNGSEYKYYALEEVRIFQRLY